MKENDAPSPQISLQRVRNRIIEYLEVAISFDSQREYHANAPVSVPNEMINQWEDWVADPTSPLWAPPVISPAERAAIADFHAVWRKVADSTPNHLPPLEQTIELPAWERLRAAAECSLRVFQQRGRLPEDRAI